MTDKEVKRLSRPQLIDIIYQLQTKNEELAEENQRLRNALTSKRIQMEKVGNIAEAALELNGVFQAAQDAAEHFLSEVQTIRSLADTERQQTILDAQEEARQIVKQAEQEAALIVSKAKSETSSVPFSMDSILKEIKQQLNKE